MRHSGFMMSFFNAGQAKGRRRKAELNVKMDIDMSLSPYGQKPSNCCGPGNKENTADTAMQPHGSWAGLSGLSAGGSTLVVEGCPQQQRSR
jgi:hypothetical protein